jgi:uncharacterized membrane protein YebE (DUF533 family)
MAGSILEQMLEAATQGGGLKGGQSGGGGQSGQGGLGDLLGQVLGGGQGGGSAKGGGGLEDILGGMLGAQPGSSGRGGASAGGGLEDILGQVLGGGGSGAGRGASPGGGGLGDILGQVLGGAQGGGSTGGRSAGGGGLGDILGQVLGGAGAARAGTSSGGGFNPGMGSLGGTSLDNGRSPSRPMPSAPAPSFPTPSAPAERPAAGQVPAPAGMNDLVKYGGIAVLGMLAYKALRNWQASQGTASAPPSGGGFLPNQMPVSGEEFSNILTQAMIAASQADGVVDEGEQQRLVGALQKLGASDADRQAVANQLRRRVDPQTLVTAAKTPEMGLEIYAASAMAVTIDSPAERKYLDGLAASLGIDPGLKAHVEQAVGRA